jgi:hypothetical protein
VVRRPTQTSITLQSVICFLMCPRKMMSWEDFYVSLCECACCGFKRIPIQPRIEQNIFMLFAAAERDDPYSKGHLEKYPFRAACKSDSKNLFEFDHRERVRWGNWVSLI